MPDFSTLFASINTAPEAPQKKAMNKIKDGHAYQLYITDAVKAGPSSKGLMGVKITADITDFEGKKYGKLWQTVYISEDPDYCMNKVFVGLCNALGIPLDCLNDLDTFAQLLNHGECLAVLKVDKRDDGKEWAKLDFFNPGVIGNINDMELYDNIYNNKSPMKMEDIPDTAEGGEVDFF